MPKSPDQDPKEAFNKFLAEAQALPAGSILPFRADPALVVQIVRDAVRAVLSRGTRIREELPSVQPSDFADVLELAQALASGAIKLLEVKRDPDSDASASELLTRAYAVRKKLLARAMAVAEAGLVPVADVRAIQAAQGRADAGNDCAALASLFERHAAELGARSGVTPEDIQAARTIGSKLQARLKPQQPGRPGAPAPEVAAAVEARDRLWTLLNQRYELVWRVGAWLFGRAVDQHVRALPSRTRTPGYSSDGGNDPTKG
jgi:hypothetical protein